MQAPVLVRMIPTHVRQNKEDLFPYPIASPLLATYLLPILQLTLWKLQVNQFLTETHFNVSDFHKDNQSHAFT